MTSRSVKITPKCVLLCCEWNRGEFCPSEILSISDPTCYRRGAKIMGQATLVVVLLLFGFLVSSYDDVINNCGGFVKPSKALQRYIRNECDVAQKQRQSERDRCRLVVSFDSPDG